MTSLASKEIRRLFGSSQPFTLLKKWLKRAKQEKNLYEPWAMHLSTSFRSRPSSRVVLLKEIKKEKLMFFTNYLSEKGKELQKNPYVACTFHWNNLKRQVRMKGSVTKVSRSVSLKYWKSRSRESQLSQWVSQQSNNVESREVLESLRNQAQKKFKNKEIPCPVHWGGYFVSVSEIEFWQERSHRLHDRFLFRKKNEKWEVQRLFP